jgi:hypothetical protein
MKYKRQVYTLLLLLATVFAGSEKAMAGTDQQLRAASALFSHFETVFFVAGSHLSEDSLDEPPREASNMVLSPLYELREAMKALAGNHAAGLLSGNDAILVGARDFLPPKGLGPVRSQRCYIIVLRGHSTVDLDAHSGTASILTVAGTKVLGWSAAIGEFGEEDPRPTSFYANTINGQYILVSNNLDDLKTISETLSSATNPNRVLEEIREWKQIKGYAVWGYRRYKRRKTGDATVGDASLAIASAEALTFRVDFGAKVCVLSVSGSEANVDGAIKGNPTAAFLPFRRQGLGTRSSTILLSDNQQSTDQLFAAISLLGFGAFI